MRMRRPGRRVKSMGKIIISSTDEPDEPDEPEYLPKEEPEHLPKGEPEHLPKGEI